jgi:hypothetical protein
MTPRPITSLRGFSLAISLVCAASALGVPSPATADAATKPAGAVDYRPGPLLTKLLEGPMAEAKVEEIVFAVRVPGRDHWYVTFGNYADYSETPAKALGFKKEDGVYWGYGEGGRLCRLNLRTGELTAILDDPRGGVRDPQMHYDGKKILFSYRPGGSHTFHLYEINVDGTNLVQLTDGPDDDIEPTYCPDGNIVFCSSRCRRFVNCWYTRVATLYHCDGEGKNIRMLSSNNDHDNTPWVLPDGRLIYMRWEYVDRSQVHFHHLWTTNPDGTGQMIYYGNMTGGIAMLDAKPIPGTKKVIASFSPGHGRPEHLGPLAIVDPTAGPDEPSSVRYLTKETDWRAQWKDPYAISEDCFLAADPRGIFVIDGQGNTEMVYQLPEEERKQLHVHEPRPLHSRPRERVIPPRTNLDKPTGRLVLEDIYRGRKMSSVRPGSIKKLLVLKQLPKPVNFSGGMQPLTIGGTFTLPQVLGTVPVEPDGSAFVELPALQSLFFVALDEEEKPVKRMHSFVVLQPGELTGCVGCHEQRTEAPLGISRDLMALRRSPSQIEAIAGVPQVMDFPRDIQPILDKHCVECHSPDRFEGQVDLTGDKTPMYTMSYYAMQSLVSDGRNRDASNYEPYQIGSAASRLMDFLDGSHYDVKISEQERTMIRIWIEASACYPGTYASLATGTYYAPIPFHEVSQRCGSCHVKQRYDEQQKKNVPVVRFGRSTSTHAGTTYNISRPEKSFILLAPLAKEAGGLGLCSEISFKDTSDPLYRSILASIQVAHQQLMEGKRFDMPGFRPNEHYIREMQRFGFIPKDLGPDDPIDVYAVDRAYWDSFEYQPQTTTASLSP